MWWKCGVFSVIMHSPPQEQCCTVTWTEWCQSVSTVLFCVSPDSATHNIPVLTEGYSYFYGPEKEVPNLTAPEEFHPGTQRMTSLIKFLILSRSILITFSFFFLVHSSTEQTLAPQATWAESVLSILTSATWQPRTDVQISVVFFCVAPLTALSKLERLFVLSCGSEQKEIASWWSDSTKTSSPGKHRVSL